MKDKGEDKEEEEEKERRRDRDRDGDRDGRGRREGKDSTYIIIRNLEENRRKIACGFCFISLLLHRTSWVGAFTNKYSFLIKGTFI